MTFMTTALVFSSPSIHHNSVSVYPVPSPQAAPADHGCSHNTSVALDHILLYYVVLIMCPIVVLHHLQSSYLISNLLESFLWFLHLELLGPCLLAVASHPVLLDRQSYLLGLKMSDMVGILKLKMKLLSRNWMLGQRTGQKLGQYTTIMLFVGNPHMWNLLVLKEREKLTGTDWTLVTTNDGKKSYYNIITQTSSWQIPTEVTVEKEAGG